MSHFDPGLQPERTALAWRRTMLSVLVVAILGARVLTPTWGVGALGFAAAGVVAALLLRQLARRRQRALISALTRSGGLATGPGAVALFVAALGAGGGSLVLLVAVLVQRWAGI